MKKLILIGRSEAGKTTLIQALKGEEIAYHKTQSVEYKSSLIDTPGEYCQVAHLGHALAVYTYEADVVGLLCSAREPYCLFPPACTAMCNRECIGIVTQAESSDGNPERAKRWLRLAGCKTIFFVDSVSGKGIRELLEYLNTT
ncbi:MAG: EutP/PduV family microcompartment system protein [Lachnospiraceae bacterium]|nr:EutP/PduV family microcompartment system protein [Lachnospiraceae bacterium]